MLDVTLCDEEDTLLVVATVATANTHQEGVDVSVVGRIIKGAEHVRFADSARDSALLPSEACTHLGSLTTSRLGDDVPIGLHTKHR